MTRNPHRPKRFAARIAIAFALAGASLAAPSSLAASSHQPLITGVRPLDGALSTTATCLRVL